MTHTILIIIFTLLMLPGIAAVALMLPGIPYLFAVALVFGFVDHFAHLSATALYVLGGIAVASIVIDQLAGALGARWGGARGKSIIIGVVCAFLGNLILPIIGGFVGLFAGIAISELHRHHSHTEALKAATSGVIGTATGMVVNLILSVVFIAAFIIFVI